MCKHNRLNEVAKYKIASVCRKRLHSPNAVAISSYYCYYYYYLKKKLLLLLLLFVYYYVVVVIVIIIFVVVVIVIIVVIPQVPRDGSELADPYVKLYLLPDPTKATKQKTKIAKRTLHPTYNETVSYLSQYIIIIIKD